MVSPNSVGWTKTPVFEHGLVPSLNEIEYLDEMSLHLESLESFTG